MADNFSTPVSGVTGAADDIGGVLFQRIKLIHGPDGTNSGDVSDTNGLPVRARSAGSQYETVAASQTDQSLGATGAAGDYLEMLICVVATAATSQVQIKDGAGSAITVLPNAVGGGVGTYPIPIGLVSTGGAWKVTTAAGVSVLATGNFT